MGRLPCVLIFACAFACAPRPAAPPPPAGFAFVGVSVIPMDSERVLADQTVMTRGDRIVAVGPAASTDVPVDMVRVDAQGKFLLPGLGDMHTHLGSADDLRLLVANGVTFVRNMWGSPLHLIWRRRIDSGSLQGPRIFTTGPIIDGKPPIWNGSAVVDTAADAERVVAEQKAAGYDFLKVYSKLSPEAYDGIVAAARQHGIRFVGHVPVAVGLEHAIAAGQYSIEHLTGYLDAIQRDDSPVKGQMSLPALVQLPRYADEAKIPAIAERTRAAGVWNCVTLVVSERFAALLAGRDVSHTAGLEYVAPLVLAGWNPDADFRLKDASMRKLASENGPRARELRFKLVRALRDAGSPILAGTDFPNPFVVPGFAIHDELALLVEAGLSPYQALRASTRDAAAFLGAPDLGTVEVGKRADLLLLDGNPLADIRATRRAAGVMVRGQWLPASDLAASLRSVKAAHAPHDRFAGLPALAGAVRYEISYNGAPAGAERLVVEGGRVRSQAVSDSPYPASDQVTIEGARVTLDGERLEGPVHAYAQGPHVRVRFADLPESRFDRSAPADAVVMGPWVAAWIPVLDKLRDLAVGGTREIGEIVLDPLTDPSAGTLAITRKADIDGARVYAFEDKRANATVLGQLIADDRGPKVLEIGDQTGVFRVVRVEPAPGP